jgi:hypothetical protein
MDNLLRDLGERDKGETMLKNKRFLFILQAVVMSFCILGLSGAAIAQKKPVRKASPKAAPKTDNTFAIKDESEKVAIQIKDITKFLYLLGGTNQLIVGIDSDPKASANAKNQSQSAKQTVIQTIRNVRAGVVQLEGEFHAKPELRPYIVLIQGVSEMAGVAEDQATGGNINNAGKTLLQVVNKLTDTLKNLR